MNKNLHNARRNKNDEFYTQLSDIEKELRHYEEHFKDKIVFSNCDDPYVSNFFQYFSKNFERLGLKKFITTCYENDQVELFSQNNIEQSIYFEYNGSQNKNGVPSNEEIDKSKKYLKGNGDFRSKECIGLLKQSDIIVTNPPFSLFREYIAQLVGYDKKFLIIGNYNAVTNKEIFPLIKESKMWVGVEPWGMTFSTPDGKEKYSRMTKWFTNLPHKKRNEELILTKTYKGNEKEYPKYDNYDAIEVSKVSNIPKDYDGVMGVPITFLVDHNPKQFEIIKFRKGDDGKDLSINSKYPYFRIIIKRR